MGPNNEHLVWVPQYLRDAKLMWLPYHLLVIGKPALVICWEGSHYGTEWTKGYKDDSTGK